MHTLIYLCLDVMMYVPIVLVDNKLLIKQVLLFSVIIVVERRNHDPNF